MKNNHFIGSQNLKALDALSLAIGQVNESMKSALTENRYCYSGLAPKELTHLVHESLAIEKAGQSLEDLISSVVNPYFKHSTNIYSPFYMAHLHSTVSKETVLGEYLIGLLNPSMDSWDQAPFATEVDEFITKIFLDRVYPNDSQVDGVFTSGGSQSNLMGLLLARDEKRIRDNIAARENSLGMTEGKYRIYCSSISHFTVEKSAWLLGLGTDSVVKLPVDDEFKIDLSKFAEILENDIENGLTPMCVVSTAGTTDYGSIDPIKEISEIAKNFGMWHHIDAAYGGAMIFNKNIEWTKEFSLCDSITIDMHKMLFQPISSSLFLYRKNQSADGLNFESDYLSRKEDSIKGIKNLVDKSLQTSRRFDSLKLLLTLKSMGLDEIEAILQSLLDTAQDCYKYLKSKSEIETLNKPELSSIVFRFKGSNEVNKAIREKLISKGIIIGETKYNKETYLKFTLLNPNAKMSDLEEVIDDIIRIGNELCK